ncbi:MAG TPA: class I SAM-dependent methyltransferase [Chitinophagaceae bacterium]|nr:class I SAM-dependent methyltransferase [Chitinophagaceae bacterium]
MLSSREIFNSHTGNLIHKWNHYFDIYDRYFSSYVDKEVKVLEIGVSQGGSIDLWKKYFGENLKYYGIDINPKCKQFDDGKNVRIFIGSQEDKTFLEKVKAEIDDIDILIDDGGHTMRQQIVTFEMLFNKIKYGGLYLCEDNHSSYWFNFGGGMKRRGTYIEYIKNLIDVMHLWYAGKNTYIKNFQLKDKIYAIHVYDSIVVIEKRKIEQPFDIKVGNYTVGYIEDEKPSLFFKIKFGWFQIKNRIRSAFYR